MAQAVPAQQPPAPALAEHLGSKVDFRATRVLCRVDGGGGGRTRSDGQHPPVPHPQARGAALVSALVLGRLRRRHPGGAGQHPRHRGECGERRVLSGRHQPSQRHQGHAADRQRERERRRGRRGGAPQTRRRWWRRRRRQRRLRERRGRIPGGHQRRPEHRWFQVEVRHAAVTLRLFGLPQGRAWVKSAAGGTTFVGRRSVLSAAGNVAVVGRCEVHGAAGDAAGVG
mmetsp:Transcript_11862/g.28790  ORF Transcript_11862/g.28790 Transcript_11862/m.28790 type:complete len:227 (-) Transcript_11862:2054-2734(-)